MMWSLVELRSPSLKGQKLKKTAQWPSGKPFADNINVIDCRSEKIAPWNGKDRYLPLSYVWGPPSQLKDDTRPFPKLISDASIFTLSIGINYLWVDKYCIDQQDPADVARQVAQMDDIYENAAATIIAASGSSSSEGLPGVSTVPRENQPWSMTSDGTLLVSSMAPISTVLTDSLWLTRAWTTMGTSESVKHSMVPLGDNKTIRNTSVVIEADLFQRHEANIERGVGKGNMFDAQMEAFSKLDLTYEEDILNAFRGVLNRQPWRSFWGIPFPTRNWWDAEYNKATALVIDDSSVDAERNNNLTPNAAFEGGMAWHKPSSGCERRRKGNFPTWCWASTLGKVIWRLLDFGVDTPRRVLASHPDTIVLPQISSRLLVTKHIVRVRLVQIQGGQFAAQNIE
ncbi:heterokaryon incompatibility protein domain-containing protein [Trichoderma velutinum]